jgi:hypothetical protein
VTTPYALLDHRVFFRDVLREVNHYATGHAGVSGATVEAGLPMVERHLRVFSENFGFVPLTLAVVGWFLVLRRDVRVGLVLVSYPVVFVGYMCAQNVFFERNVVAVHFLERRESRSLLESSWRRCSHPLRSVTNAARRKEHLDRHDPRASEPCARCDGRS